MSGSVKVLVDSSAGISPQLARTWDVDVVPLTVSFGGRTFRDGIDLVPTEFYAELARSDTNPVTAAPAPADFSAACRAALAANYQRVLIVTVSSAMSATHNHARLAAQDFAGDAVVVLDSGQGAGAQALIAAHAARVAAAGESCATVIAAAQRARETTELFMAVDTLTYLHRSGRISLPRAILGQAIQMKPILTFVEGRLQPVEKPRTMRRAASRLVERLTGSARSAAHVMVMFADHPSPMVMELVATLQHRLPGVEIDMAPVSAVVGGHTGPGLLGCAVRWHDDA